MSDVFISYSSEDLDRIKPLVVALENIGLSVWWDRVIPPGKSFSKVIEQAISDTRCVVVLWSKISVDSDWVLCEASEGMAQKKLVPGLIDDVKIPLEFRRLQSADLINWKGEPDHSGLNSLVGAISSLVESRQDKKGVSTPEPDGDKLARKLSTQNGKTNAIAKEIQLYGGEEKHRLFPRFRRIINKKRIHRLVIAEIIASWGMIANFALSFSPLGKHSIIGEIIAVLMFVIIIIYFAAGIWLGIVSWKERFRFGVLQGWAFPIVIPLINMATSNIIDDIIQWPHGFSNEPEFIALMILSFTLTPILITVGGYITIRKNRRHNKI